jgi:beta-glucuronidase
MKRALFFLVWMLPISAVVAAQSPAPLIQNSLGRSGVSLNGDWHFVVDPDDIGDGRRYYLNVAMGSTSGVVEYNFAASPTLHVPGDWNSQRRELDLYEGKIWYEKSFQYHHRAGTRAYLYFGAANYRAHIWVNGQSLCVHEAGFTSFNCDATSLLRDGDNFIVVSVDDTRHADDIPALRTDWWNYGGLTRDVRITEVPETFIQDYSVQLQTGARNQIAGWIRLTGATGPQKVTLRIPELKLQREVTTDSAGMARFEFDAPTLARWSPENPKLYSVEIASETDRVADEIGFRTVETRGTEILLNGQPVFLRGINLHEEALYRAARAHGDDDARTLLSWAKELGCNFVRLAHYPHDEHITRMADRMGLMVWSEVPLWQGIAWSNPSVLPKAKQQVTEMIARDHNRASIIFWSVTNESQPGPDRNAFLHELVATTRALDATRLITAASNHMTRPGPHQVAIDDPLIADLDVVGMNEYIGWYEGAIADLDVTTWTDPYNKPVIVSEFGADAKQGLHGEATQRWTEEYQADLFEHHIAAFRKVPFIRGTAPWILKDFRSPRRQLPGIQDGFNRKGLISDQGERKKAFFVLQDFYRQQATR